MSHTCRISQYSEIVKLTDPYSAEWSFTKVKVDRKDLEKNQDYQDKSTDRVKIVTINTDYMRMKHSSNTPYPRNLVTIKRLKFYGYIWRVKDSCSKITMIKKRKKKN